MPMRRPHWKDWLVVAAWIGLFFLFLRPIFDHAHPFGSDNLTVRLASAIIFSAMVSGGIAAFLGLILSA
jgi:hypothetical protein